MSIHTQIILEVKLYDLWFTILKLENYITISHFIIVFKIFTINYMLSKFI